MFRDDLRRHIGAGEAGLDALSVEYGIRPKHLSRFLAGGDLPGSALLALLPLVWGLASTPEED
jgi:hypothetical protein